MMVQAAGRNGQEAVTVPSWSTQQLGSEAFLKLLVAELRHQNPLDPLKDRDFIAQLAQFNSLDTLNRMEGKLGALDELARISDKLDRLTELSAKLDRLAMASLQIAGLIQTVQSAAGEATTGEPAAGESAAGEPAAGESAAGEPAAGEV